MLKMQSTLNYLWNTDDVLGQGATASVYKARNKVSEGQENSTGWDGLWAGSLSFFYCTHMCFSKVQFAGSITAPCTLLTR